MSFDRINSILKSLEEANVKRRLMSKLPYIGEDILQKNIIQINRLQNELADAMKGFKPMNEGGFVDMNQYGLGQFSVPFSSLDGGESASTPDKAIKNALKSGDASDEYLVALAKANKAKSPAARKALLDIANEKNMADKFSYNMGMFG